MRSSIFALLLLLFASTASAVVIDFEEYVVPAGSSLALNSDPGPNRGDTTSKGFTLDYLDQGAGQPNIWAADIGFGTNGTQNYVNCPNCVAIEQIDVFSTDNLLFSLSSIDVGAAGPTASFDFIITGFLSGGGTIVQSTLGVTSGPMETMVFGSSWSSLDSFRIEIVNDGDNTLFSGASLIDNIVVNVVPIPAAVWLFGSGLGLLGWLRRRKIA